MPENENPVMDINIRKLIRSSINSNNELIDKIRFFKNLITNLNVAIFIHDINKLHHVWTNDNYYKIIGYTDEEIKNLGPDWAKENYHPDDLYLLEERINYFRSNAGESYSGVYRVKHKKGHWVWLYSNVVVYKRDENELPELLLGICIDFSDNFKTMKQFKELYRYNMRLKNQLLIEKLTKREKEVIRYITQGKTSQEMADIMHISKLTVNNHRKNILRKLNLHNIAELSHFATEGGLD